MVRRGMLAPRRIMKLMVATPILLLILYEVKMFYIDPSSNASNCQGTECNK